MLPARSKSTLFLMEQLIVIAVFAFCAAVCVKIFVDSHQMTVESKNKKNALIAAENFAEVYKAVKGNLYEAAPILNGVYDEYENNIKTFYDNNWNQCHFKEAVFVVSLFNTRSSPFIGLIQVSIIGGNEILSFEVAAGKRGSDMFE